MSLKLSICIPTFNRPGQLPNCLNSICIAKANSDLDFDVCISDNGSNYDVKSIIDSFNDRLNITLNINKKNLGYQPNLIKAISLSKSEFVWTMGDDDLLTPNSLNLLNELFKKFKDVDFYYINSYHLNYEYLKKFKKPFDTNLLPEKMSKLAKKKNSMKCKFWDLIDYRITFDFLMGNFTNVFKRKMFLENLDCLNEENLKDNRLCSNLDNCCGYIKVYAHAFKNSKAYYSPEGFSVNCYGVREWASMYDFMEIVRIPEILDYYRSQGLGLKKYLINKNYALRNFSNFFFKIFIRGNSAGRHYVNFYRHFLLNLIFPNAILSTFYYLFRKITSLRKAR
jgi:glycosyltransferase involved in cell wall biosynthesis